MIPRNSGKELRPFWGRQFDKLQVNSPCREIENYLHVRLVILYLTITKFLATPHKKMHNMACDPRQAVAQYDVFTSSGPCCIFYKRKGSGHLPKLLFV